MSEHSEASPYTWLNHLRDLNLGRELAVKTYTGIVATAVSSMQQHKSALEHFAKLRKLDQQLRGIESVPTTLAVKNRSASANKIKTLSNVFQDDVQDQVLVSGTLKIGGVLASMRTPTFPWAFAAGTKSDFTWRQNTAYTTHASSLAAYVLFGNAGGGTVGENGNGRLGIEDIAGIYLGGAAGSVTESTPVKPPKGSSKRRPTME